MTYSKTGLQLTESFEGCRLNSYQDQTGRWTIGYGHVLGVQPGDTVTQAQAEELLAEDIAWAVREVNSKVTITISQPMFDALVDWTFNLGSSSLEHSTLLRLINEGKFETAANQFELWDHAGGQVVAGLLRRRQAEEQEFNGQQV